MIKWMTD